MAYGLVQLRNKTVSFSNKQHFCYQENDFWWPSRPEDWQFQSLQLADLSLAMTVVRILELLCAGITMLYSNYPSRNNPLSFLSPQLTKSQQSFLESHGRSPVSLLVEAEQCSMESVTLPQKGCVSCWWAVLVWAIVQPRANSQPELKEELGFLSEWI